MIVKRIFVGASEGALSVDQDHYLGFQKSCKGERGNGFPDIPVSNGSVTIGCLYFLWCGALGEYHNIS